MNISSTDCKGNLFPYSNIVSFIDHINNTVKKLLIYFNSHKEAIFCITF